MRRRRSRIAAVIASTLMTPLALGCSRDMPTSTASVRTKPEAGGPTAPASGSVDFALLSDATSSIRSLPEMGILDGGGVWGDLQSDYFRTTASNREFRRGFAEFSVPALGEGFRSARLVLRETRATISLPVPPDRQELSCYTDADLVVDAGDFDRPTSPVGTFETDANLETQTFAFDVTRVLERQRGSTLGFRVKLEADPVETGFGSKGSAFSRASTPPGVVIELTGAGPADAADYMRHVIERLQLTPGVKESLLEPLASAVRLLRDDIRDNDREACAHLAAFLAAVDRATGTPEAPGELPSPESGYLRGTAERVSTALGCSGP